LLRGPPDEVVTLWEGDIELEVERLAEDGRFRVVVVDAEVEVWGTSFSVMARADHLQSVSVVRGRMIVRRTGTIPSCCDQVRRGK